MGISFTRPITTLKDKKNPILEIIRLEGSCGERLGQPPLKTGVDCAVLGKALQITSSREWLDTDFFFWVITINMSSTHWLRELFTWECFCFASLSLTTEAMLNVLRKSDLSSASDKSNWWKMEICIWKQVVDHFCFKIIGLMLSQISFDYWKYP